MKFRWKPNRVMKKPIFAMSEDSKSLDNGRADTWNNIVAIILRNGRIRQQRVCALNNALLMQLMHAQRVPSSVIGLHVCESKSSSAVITGASADITRLAQNEFVSAKTVAKRNATPLLCFRLQRD